MLKDKRQSWEPDASKPANFDGHWGPFRPADTNKVLHHTHVPGYLVDELERNRETWKTSVRGQWCTNCGAGFLIVDVYKPIHFPFFAFVWETYSYEADK